MEIEILHVTHGDKKKKIDTDTPEGREVVSDIIKSMMTKGTNIYLERGKKTYKVTGYDPSTDSLKISVETKGKEKTVKASGRKSKVTGVPAIAGG